MDFRKACALLTMVMYHCNNYSSVLAESNCPAVRLANGRAQLRSKGRLINFRCRKGFELVGVKLAVCLPTGQWSQQIPTCVGTTCKKPDLQANMTVEKIYNGGVLKFACGPGLTRSGPEMLMCDGNKWNDKPPVCEVGMVMSCDFEKEGLCGWSHDNTDDFDWTWNKGNTPTAQTGPSFDHTTNSTDGHYLFMESSAPQKSGDKTRIISPPYPADVSNLCFQFFYHMLGPDGDGEVGDLDVLVKRMSGRISSLRPVNIFHKSGNQGDRWLMADVQIPRQTESFQILIQATRLKSWTGDIAIDDVKLHNCLESTTVTTTPILTNAADVDDSSDDDDSADTPATNKRTRSLPSTTALVSDSKISTKSRPQPPRTTPIVAAAKTTQSPALSSSSKSATSPITMKATSTSRIKLTSTTPKNIATKEMKTQSVNSQTTARHTSQPPSDTTEKNTGTKSPAITSTTTTRAISTPSFTDNPYNKHSNNYDYEKMDNKTGSRTVVNSESNDNEKISSENDKSDAVDYIDTDSSDYNSDINSFRNNTSKLNESSTPFTDYEFDNKSDVEDTSSGDENIDVDGLIPDHEAVEGDHNSQALLPLIIGVVVSVAVGAAVIAVLVWIWVRSQRQKQDKEQDDQMNIIAEYVETNLSI